jgi:hypothetical protein
MALSWTQALLEAAYRRGWLVRSVQGKVTFLLDQGLHIEQALLGTGLLTMSQYADLVQEQFGYTLQRLDQDAWTLAATSMPLPEGAAAAIDEQKVSAVLVSDPWIWKESAWFKRASNVLPVFRSDILRWLRHKEPVDFAMSAWWEALSQHEVTEARLLVHEGKGEVWLGSGTYPDPELALSREEVPALQAWLEVGFPQTAWTTTRIAGAESDIVEMVHTSRHHPLAGMTLWQTFLQEPKGVLAILSPDAWLERALQHLPDGGNHATLFTSAQLVRIRPLNDQDREAAHHAALTGCPLCWIEDAPSDHTWMRTLAQAGVPVHVIRSRQTAHGATWEAYTISL